MTPHLIRASQEQRSPAARRTFKAPPTVLPMRRGKVTAEPTKRGVTG